MCFHEVLVANKMLTRISPEGVSQVSVRTRNESDIESEKIRYLVLKNILGTTGRFRLGFAWIILEPMLVALIYVFLFSVIKSNITGELIIIGIGTYGVFSSSFKAGMSGISDTNGGFTAERVRTSVLIKSQLLYSSIEGSIRAISMLALLFALMDINFPASLIFIPICALLSILSRAIGFNLVLITINSPDIRQVIDFAIRLLFFISPVLYPYSSTVGTHREFNDLNPLTYFIEISRYYCGSVEQQILPEDPITILAITIFLLLGFRGIWKLDSYRWRVSTWN